MDCLVIVDSTSIVPLGSSSESFRGLAGIFNEQAGVLEVKMHYAKEGTPTALQTAQRGMHLGEEQVQVQDMGTGFDPSRYFLICEPTPIAPGSTIAAHADIRSPQNTDGAYAHTASDFVLPAVNSTVSVELIAWLGVDANTFAPYVGAYVDRETNLGVCIGGCIFDLVSIDDATHITVRNRNLPCAVVTAIG